MDKKKIVICTSFLLIFTVLGQSVIAQETQTTTPNLETLNSTFYVPDDFPTIQDAISNEQVKDYDTIIVRPGVYDEEININKALYLIGEDKETTIIEGDGKNVAITISSNYAKISDFTIRNANYDGIEIRPNYYGVEVINNIILNNPRSGVFMFGCNHNIIKNNLIKNSDDSGIYIIDGHHNEIVGNIIKDNSDGIELLGSWSNDIGGEDNLKNHFESNIIGIRILPMPVYKESDLLEDNTFDNNDDDIIGAIPVYYHGSYGGSSPAGQLVNILLSSF